MAAQPEQTSSVLSTLQAEVSAEASPMLQFLARHARSIVIVFLLFIAAIIGYWVYSWQSGKQTSADIRELGSLLIITDPTTRLSKLDDYLRSAPEKMRPSAWFAALEAAREAGNQEKVRSAWQAIATLDAKLGNMAALGTASSLASQDKYQEAAAVLAKAVAGAKGAEAALLNMQLVLYAEVAGDYKRALEACDALVRLQDESVESRFWEQKKAALEQKTAAVKP